MLSAAMKEFVYTRQRKRVQLVILNDGEDEK
jgi:hypothetical protein